MKIYLLFLNFLFCFSHILNEINHNLVDKAFSNLPLRYDEAKIDLLELVNKISKMKEEYSMTVAETVFLIFKWISRTLQYDCYGKNHGGIITDPFETYRQGKGGDEGLTTLFTTICGFLNIEAHVIAGIDKFFNITVEFNEKYWNVVLIEDKYYILDIVAGMGYCSGDRFGWPQGFDTILFGLNPETLIRHRFPYDSKWQLISNPIEKNEFIYSAYLYEDFFQICKSIYPDVLILKSGKELITIKLTFVEPLGQIDNLKVFAEFHNEYLDIINLNILNGVLEFSLYLTKSGILFLSLLLDKVNYWITWYKVN